MKPLIVGQAPGPSEDGWPLMGRCGDRLAVLFGLSVAEYAIIFERVNLLPKFPGKKGKGDAFDRRNAAIAARNIKIGFRMSSRPFSILLGRNVAEAFGFEYRPLGVQRHHELGHLVFLPHPSGINRWWNEPENVWRAKKLLRRLVRAI